MQTTVKQLTLADLDAVDDLMKRHRQTLGFLPKAALESYLRKEKGGVWGAKTDTGQLIGYLLYAANPNYFRITHLCILEKYQNQGIAKRLVNDLKKSATTQRSIKLNCRRDFPADALWPKLGFVALDEKPSRSGNTYLLASWQLTLAVGDQLELELFQAEASSEVLDVIIDAHVFFDFDEPAIDKTIPSKALLSDFLVGSLNLWITDELLNEIHRQENLEKRKKSRSRARSFSIVESNPDLFEDFEKLLKEFLPSQTPSQRSDIRQLAKAAASNVKTFVTRDTGLLKHAKKIFDITGLEVVSPAELIVRLYELSEGQSYAPDRIAGLHLRWEPLTSDDLTNFPLNSFLEPGERKGKFREKLESLIAQPKRYKCEFLQSDNNIIALRILTSNSNQMLASPLVRVASSTDRSRFGRFLIADTISKAVENNLDMVKFERSALTSNLIPSLLEMGFIQCKDSLVRFCFASCLSREQVLSAISRLYPETASKYRGMSDLELERYCSPLVLASGEEKYFLIPIRPAYAMGLIDRAESSRDLFGGDPNVLLRWDNVYYRSKSFHRMLAGSGRILWYVSKQKEIVAISHLDDVVIDTTKELFRKFKRFGILEWRDLYEMCDRDPSKEIMALKFSHTFLFRKTISLDSIRGVYGKNDAGLSLQGPSKVPPEVFHELFQQGYPN